MEHTNYIDNQAGEQISYDSVWPNFPLQVVHHQAPSSSAPHLHYDHHLQFANFMMDQEEIATQREEEDNPQEEEEEEEEELGAMKEMMYKIAAMQQVDIDPATIRKPKRRNVRISDDPQSVAARHQRVRISEKIRILQRLVPEGTKMDTASMLDEAIRYVKSLKRQIRLLQQQSSSRHQHQHQQCINTNATTLVGSAAALQLDWQLLPPTPVPASSVNDDTPSTTRPVGFTAFGGGGRGEIALSINHHEVLSSD